MKYRNPEDVLPEKQRRLHLLGPTASAATYQQMQARAAETYIPLKVLWAWRRAFQQRGEEGLAPTDWKPWATLSPTVQQAITERLAQLGDLVTAPAIPDVCNLDEYIPVLAKQNQWSLRTAERWVRRYQVGGWWGLAPRHDPAKAGRMRDTAPPPALGTLDDTALEETFRRRTLLGDLATQPKVSRAEVEAQAKAVGVAPSTLWLYLKQFRDARLAGLAPRERSDKNGHRISEQMCQIIRGVRFASMNKSVRAVYEAVRQKAEALGEPVPSEWQVRQVCAEITEPEALLAEGREDKFRNSYEVTIRMEQMRRESFLIVYQIDHTLVDVLVKDLRSATYRTKSGEIRPWLTLCIDSRSRLVMAAVFGYDHPDRYTVATAIRDAVLTSDQKLYGGIPHELWVDNGKELLAHHVHQLAQGLQFTLHPCKPHRPQEKGIVERFFGTLNTRLWAEQPGYVASNTEERDPHAKATLTLAELEQRFWAFIQKYHQEVHSETEETPLEYWARYCYAEPADPRDLDILLKEPIDRVVVREGIQYKNRIYWNAIVPELVGQHVDIRVAPIYRAPDEIEVFQGHQWMCTARATDVQVITQRDMGTAKRTQKEHLQRGIKRAKEATEAVDREIAANLPPRDPAPPTPPPSKPKKQGSSEGSPPLQKPRRGDFLERMAEREEEQRKREEA